MALMICALLASFLVSMLIVRTGRAGRGIAQDSDLGGPQKFHTRPVPRIGGLALFVGVLAGTLMLAVQAAGHGRLGLLVIVCSLPAFLAGLTEDLTKTQSPRRRLFFTAVAAWLGAVLIDGVIQRTAIPGLDWAVSFPVIAVLVTVFVVAGVANSINIIDGFNGLASMSAVLMLIAIGYVAYQVGDYSLMYLSLIGIGSVVGFFFVNFPLGLIFLGDGGAYFLGFYVAELAILLLHRNAAVSPMFPLLVCIYPVFETVFSIYRRSMLRKQSPGSPDGIHLHSLIYRRFMRWALGDQMARTPERRNSMVAPYLWMLCMLAVVPAMLFWSSTPALVAFILLFGFVYTGLYWRIVRFRSPRWLASRSRAR